MKIYYRYLNNNGELKRSLNISSIRMSNSEKYNILDFEKSITYNTNKGEIWSHKLLIDLNYIIGQCFGNLRYAFKKYYDLTIDIAKYCREANIKLIVLGIGYRNNTPFAKVLCNKLNNYLQSRLASEDILYIENLSYLSRNTDQYFQKDGIHASDKYHELVAGMLFNELNS